MSRAIESTNAAIVAEARPISSEKLADEVADLMGHRGSPFAAADVFLKQIAMRSGSQQTDFINHFENNLNAQYGKNILPDLLLYSGRIGQPGHDTPTEIALAAATHDTVQDLQLQNFPQRSPEGAFFNDDPNWSTSGNSDNSVNSISRDRNAINSTKEGVNGVGADRNALGTFEAPPVNQSAKFALVENLLHDNPAIRDWMRRSCGTNEITQADLQTLLSKRLPNLDPARESVYHDLAVLNANWNNPEFSKIQSTFPHSSVKYLDMSKVMDIEPVPLR